VEDFDLLAGRQRHLAPGGGDFHFAAGQPARLDGGVRQYDDVQYRCVGHGHRHDRADVDSYLYSDLPTKRVALMLDRAPGVAPVPEVC